MIKIYTQFDIETATWQLGFVKDGKSFNINLPDQENKDAVLIWAKVLEKDLNALIP